MVIFGNSDDRPEDELEDGQLKQTPDEEADTNRGSDMVQKQKPDEEANTNSKNSEDIERMKSELQDMRSEVSTFRKKNRELKDKNDDLREKIDQMMSMYDGYLSDINPAMESLEDNKGVNEETKEQLNNYDEASIEKDTIRMMWMDDIVSEYNVQTALRVLYYYHKRGDISEEERHRCEGILQLHPLYDNSSDNTDLNEIDRLDDSLKHLSEEYRVELE